MLSLFLLLPLAEPPATTPAAVTTREPSAVDRPNVLVMMVDDLGWSDLGCYGSEIETPHLDALAASGVRFTQFYNTAKCAETRATLLSGRYHGDVQRDQLANCWTLAEAMHTASYATAMSGKWHLNGNPCDRGFDPYWGHLSGATDFFAGDDTFRLDREPWDDFGDDFYTTDAAVDWALRFIGEAREQDRPWFQYIAFNAPHYPLQAPKEDVEKYLSRYGAGYHTIQTARLAKQKTLGLVDAEIELPPWPADARRWEVLLDAERYHETRRMATFAGMVDHVDQAVGRLLDDLRQHGELDNTLVLFFSDNGGCPFDRNHNLDREPWEARSHWTYDTRWAHVSNTPWREYKRNQHEGGIASPLIVHWPRGLMLAEGSLVPAVSHLVDVMPTLLELTGTPYPETHAGRTLGPLRGRSLLPILRGQPPADRGTLMFDWSGMHHAIREGRFKLVAKDRGPWELYDIEADRQELHDLSESQPERRQRLVERWTQEAAEIGWKRKAPAKPRKKRAGQTPAND